jgi:hypothetical protein
MEIQEIVGIIVSIFPSYMCSLEKYCFSCNNWNILFLHRIAHRLSAVPVNAFPASIHAIESQISSYVQCIKYIKNFSTCIFIDSLTYIFLHACLIIVSPKNIYLWSDYCCPLVIQCLFFTVWFALFVKFTTDFYVTGAFSCYWPAQLRGVLASFILYMCRMSIISHSSINLQRVGCPRFYHLYKLSSWPRRGLWEAQNIIPCEILEKSIAQCNLQCARSSVEKPEPSPVHAFYQQGRASAQPTWPLVDE